MRSTKLIALLGALVVVALIAIGAILGAHRESAPATGEPQAGPYRGSHPPPGIPLPQFALPRIGGGILSSKATRGHIVLTTFVDSACKEKCPIIVGILGDALSRLNAAERAEVVPLAFSVNPKVDTPSRVARFLAERGASQLIYLVAPLPEMRPVWKKFGILSAVETGNSDIHSADVRVFDLDGIWVTTLHAGVDLTAANLVHDIHAALERS
jgi:cytochrome oxidase Cu insertion factor (SCO1/SenC/PrrC family)